MRLVNKQISHENIIAPTEVRLGPLRTELVMEYAPHGTLEGYTKARGPRGVTEAEGRRLFGQLLEAMAYLHARRIVHRDVRAQNCSRPCGLSVSASSSPSSSSLQSSPSVPLSRARARPDTALLAHAD